MTIRILETQVYRGANIWTRMPAIRMLVDIGELEDWPSDKIDGFNDQLISLLPSLYDHYCSRGRPGGFIERLHEGTWLGHVMEHVALELQTLAGSEVNRGLTREAEQRGVYNVVYQCNHSDLGLAAGYAALRLVNWLAYRDDPDYSFETELENIIRLAEEFVYGPSTKALVEEAERRGIPVLRLDQRRSLIQMGHGVYQKRIWATVTSGTSDIAVDIAGNKHLTSQFLRGIGIPVPESVTVDSFDAAIEAAGNIGFPVVLKPLDGNHGRGVSTDLQTVEDVRQRFEVAYEESDDGRVIVESFIRGRDYRILIVNGTMVACSERVPAHVTGDGSHTIRDLIEIVNADPRRGIGHERVLTRISVDESVIGLLERQGFDLDSVPGDDQFVRLRMTGNMSTGGTAIDRTDDIHPDNIEIAEQAAQMIGLDVAGIDMIADDIAHPLKDQGGAICEVNAGPGFRMHTHPTEGHPRDVARPVLDLLFPTGTRARIPIIAVTGTNGKTTTCRMVAHILQMSGKRVGLTTTDGIYIDGTQILKGDMSGPRSAQMVLQNPTVDHAVLETARGGILREGLGFDRCDVSVVTNISADHIGLRGVNSLEDLAEVKSIVPAATFRDGHAVLNADDPMCMTMVERARGELILFSLDENNPHIREHLRSRGTAVFLREEKSNEVIYVAEGRRETALLSVQHIPATFQGRARVNVKNALAATAVAYASNVGIEMIRNGLRSFTTSFYQAPGRLNLLEVAGYRVLVDYCHNVAGMEELADFVKRMVPTHTIAVLSMAGDRRDDDMARYGSIAASAFDEFILREDRWLRGRKPGEVAGILRQALLDNGVADGSIQIIPNETEAVNAALDRARSEDLVVLLADSPEQVWETVVARSRLVEAG